MAPPLSQAPGSKRPISFDFSTLSSHSPSPSHSTSMASYASLLPSPPHCHALLYCHSLVTPHCLQASWLHQAPKKASDFQNEQQSLKPKDLCLSQHSWVRYICINKTFNISETILPLCKTGKKKSHLWRHLQIKWDDYESPLSNTRHCTNDGHVSHYRHPSDTLKHRSEYGAVFCRTVQWFPNDCSIKSKFFPKILHNPVPTIFPDHFFTHS